MVSNSSTLNNFDNGFLIPVLDNDNLIISFQTIYSQKLEDSESRYYKSSEEVVF